MVSVVFYIRLLSDPTRDNHQPGNEDKYHDNVNANKKTTFILLFALFSTPFLTVRVIYMLLSTFANNASFKGRDLDGDGNADTPANVYVVAFMQYLMESIVFALFMYAGVVMPSLRKAKEIEKEKKNKLLNCQERNERV